MPGITTVLADAIRIKAKAHRIPESLLRAVVLTESSGREDATRYEGAYRWMVAPRTGGPFRRLTQDEAMSATPPPDFFPQAPDEAARIAEWRGQRTSWGPMQVMGAVARQFGFRGPFEQLSGVWGLYYGCLLLERLRERFHAQYGWEGVAAAYNAGTPRKVRVGNRWENQPYIDKLRRNGARFEEYAR